MPTYLPSRGGVLLSEAYAEAAARARLDRVMLATYELRHSSFTAVRIVNDYQNFTGTLEATAPVDPGAAVEFIALPIQISGPEEGDNNEAPAISITIDNVSRILAEQLDLAVASLEPIYITERIYASDEPEAPAVLPVLTLVLREAEVSENRVTARAAFYDPTNRGFPKQEYTTELYPGLSAR